MEEPSTRRPQSKITPLYPMVSSNPGVRCCQEHHEMFILNKDGDQGTKYITFEKNPTKTRQGGLRKKRRAIEPKILPTGGPRCPVSFFKTFVARRPEEMRRNGPFYLAIIEK